MKYWLVTFQTNFATFSRIVKTESAKKPTKKLLSTYYKAFLTGGTKIYTIEALPSNPNQFHGISREIYACGEVDSI